MDTHGLKYHLLWDMTLKPWMLGGLLPSEIRSQVIGLSRWDWGTASSQNSNDWKLKSTLSNSAPVLQQSLCWE